MKSFNNIHDENKWLDKVIVYVTMVVVMVTIIIAVATGNLLLWYIIGLES